MTWKTDLVDALSGWSFCHFCGRRRRTDDLQTIRLDERFSINYRNLRDDRRITWCQPMRFNRECREGQRVTLIDHDGRKAPLFELYTEPNDLEN